MTITNIRKNRVFKATNILLIYALLLDITVPFAQTMDTLLSIPSQPNYSGIILPNTAPIKEVFEEYSSVIHDKPEVLEEMDLEQAEQSQKLTSVLTSSSGGSGFSINMNDEMVDPFTGDFFYSIPLMDVEGYPITLSYNSNITMNTEASWVGLGWNLNVGSVEREMRGIPDEFDGTQIVVRTTNQLDDITSNGYKRGKYWNAGINIKLDDYLKLNIAYNSSKLRGFYTNTYLGNGHTYDKTSGWDLKVGTTIYFVGLSVGGSFGKYFSYDSKRGINRGVGGGLTGGISIFGVGPNFNTYSSKNFNSREGMTGKTVTRGWGLSANAFSVSVSTSSSHTSTIPYGSQTMVPRVQLNSINRGASATRDRSFLLGVKLNDMLQLGATLGKLEQSYWSARYDTKDGNTIYQPAIGYLHSSKKFPAFGYVLPIMDFNRSNDTRYSEQMTTLPFSMQTFDIFHANGMGMQGTFRAHRTDAGTYIDAAAVDESTELTILDKQSTSLSTFTEEGGYGASKTTTYSKDLKKSNGTHVLEFNTAVDPVNGFDQSVYFKGVGETTPVDASLYDLLKGRTASRAHLLKVGSDISLQNSIVTFHGATSPLPPDGKVTLTKPTPAISFRPRTTSELLASDSDYEKKYYNYSKNDINPNPSAPSIVEISRDTSLPNVISRIEVTNDNGVSYGYGIPSFSNSSSQVLFNIGSNSGAPTILTDANGLVTYSYGDNSVSNTKGLAHYYDKTTVPTYAESFLLTDMCGTDYVDRTGNGPTPDDIGSYFKFNYTRLYENYHWRFPFGNQKAFYQEGTVGSELDDMASYSFGTKEVWVTHSVESKNYIAEFLLDVTPRADGYGVNENGTTISGEKTYALKQIRLYSRADRKTNGNAAKALQIVEFTYDYELCQNYPPNGNSTAGQKGKLTLQSVSVYTGDSYENQRSSFSFDYGTGAAGNPDFNYGKVDAWGQYKPGDVVFNSRFPYVAQSQAEADNNSQAWKLKRVVSPSGGTMDITYESDRYGFVQRKRVMKHMKFEGLTNIFDLFSMKYEHETSLSKIRQTMNTSAYSISPYAAFASLTRLVYNVFYGKFYAQSVPNNIVVFKLDEPISMNDPLADQKVKNDYFTDNGEVMKELYLKAQIRVTNNDTRAEIVPLFAGISRDLVNALSDSYPVDDAPAIGVLPPVYGSEYHTYGYVVLDPYKVRNPKDEDLDNGADYLNDNIFEDEAFNPIQKAAFDFFQQSLTDIVYQNTAFSSGMNSLDFFTGAKMDINKAMRQLGFGPSLIGDYSTMRVYIPSNIKYGGGSRVKSIQFSDNWQNISGEYTSNYKVDYIYDFDQKTSGVASYESRISNDESAFYQWNSYYDIRVRYPDKFNYTPTPAMEILFPTGSVGYSKVATQYNNLTDRGYSVSTFYTAWDKPLFEDNTDLKKEEAEVQDKNSGIYKKICAFSQGFSLETNDFHGKIKSNAVYKGSLDEISKEAIPATLLSKTSYNYFNAGEKQKIADETGTIVEREVGLDYDIHADSRVIEVTTKSLYQAISRVWPFSFPPIPAVDYITNNSFAFNAFFSHALIKHANRSAILKSVETEYMGSLNTAENLVFDKYSGGVIVSSLTDEFNDKMYSIEYPAHWYYSELRNVSSSQDKRIQLTLGSNTTITNPAIIKQLSPGDKLKFTIGNTTSYAWVAKAYPWPLTPKYFLIDQYGNEFTIPSGTYTVTIAKSGRSNELTAIMQGVTTKKNPLSGANINFPTTDILSGGAITLRDRLNVLCKTPGGPDIVNNNNAVNVGIVNPYRYGIRGDLILDNQLSWQDTRVQATTANGVRKDGAYSSFVPYYALSSGEWYPLTHPSHPNYDALKKIHLWRKSGEGTLYNQYGAQIEVKDPLRINSAILYGYNPKLQLLPTAMAQNARKQEIAFDGFEDYNYYQSQPMDNFETHFSFTTDDTYKVEAVKDIRHSGQFSVRVAPAKQLKASRLMKSFQEAKTVHSDNTSSNTGQVQNCDCINNFSPSTGEYVVGAWVKQSIPNSGIIKVEITDNNNAILYTTSFGASSVSLDGWQRLEQTIAIPSNIPIGTSTINIYLMNTSSGEVYFDDFRIHPFQASMVTTVYDPKTLLKIASHDSYNYTTFYNYDENNQLVRVRVETNEGIKTISESEMSVYKQP